MRLDKIAASLALTANLACGALPKTPVAPEIQDQRAEVAHKICDQLGPGIHQIDGKKAYCFYPQGIAYDWQNFDMPPEAKELKLTDVPQAINGKRVVLFGEDHQKSKVPANELVNMIADEHFDSIGLELDKETFQPIIDEFYKTGDFKKFEEATVASNFRTRTIEIIKAARQRNIPVICIDNRQEKNYEGLNLEKPLGYRLAKDFGLENIYSIIIDDSSQGERFVDAYLPTQH